MTYADLESVHFDGARFFGNTMFEGAHFGGFASFRDTHFRGHAWFNDSKFKGAAIFMDSRIEWNAAFFDVEFGDYCTFDDVDFRGHANFSNSQARGTVTMKGCRFREIVKFGSFDVPAGKLKLKKSCVERMAARKSIPPKGWDLLDAPGSTWSEFFQLPSLDEAAGTPADSRGEPLVS